MFHRDAVAAGFDALSHAARARHRRRRLHRQQPRRPAARRRGRGRRLRQLHAPAGASSWTALERRRELVEGDVLDRARSTRGDGGLRHRLPPAGQRRRALRARAPPRDLEQNTIATSTVLEAMRADGVDADRVLLDRLGLRRARGLPDARGRALPGPDLALRGLEARGRGADRRLLPRLRLHRRRLPLRLGPRRALHARARVRLLPRAARRPDAAARARRRPPAQKSYLYVGDCVDGDPHRRWPRATEPGLRASTTSARTRRSSSTTRSRRSARTSASTPRSSTPAASAAGSATARSSTSTARGSARWAGRRRSRSARRVERTLDWFDANPCVFDGGRPA